MTENITAPHSLQRFATKKLKYIRIVEKKHAKGGGRAKRVLALNMTALILTNMAGDVLRFISYDKIREVVTQEDASGLPQVLVKSAPPEHDILLFLTLDATNTSPSSLHEANRLASIIQKNAKAFLQQTVVVHSPEQRGPLTAVANLQRSPQFVPPAEVLRRAKEAGEPLVRVPKSGRSASPNASPMKPTEDAADRQRKDDALEALRKEKDASRDKEWDLRMSQFDRRERDLKYKQAELDRMVEEKRAANVYIGGIDEYGESSSNNDDDDDDGLELRTSEGPHAQFRDFMTQQQQHSPEKICTCGASPQRKPTGPLPAYGSPLHGSSFDAGNGGHGIGTPSPPPLRNAHEIDYWTRFVLRWEAEGLTHVEGL